MPLLRSAALAMLAAGSLAVANAQESILEKYVLGTGQDSDGTAIALSDKLFGSGTARAAVAFRDTARSSNATDLSGRLVLNVSRRVPPGQIVFALLCFGVEVRGFDATGEKVFSEDLPGFTFGDSQGGRYTQVLRGIPVNVARLEITFFGNYE